MAMNVGEVWAQKLAALGTPEEKINFLKEILVEKDDMLSVLSAAVEGLKHRVEELEKGKPAGPRVPPLATTHIVQKQPLASPRSSLKTPSTPTAKPSRPSTGGAAPTPKTPTAKPATPKSGRPATGTASAHATPRTSHMEGDEITVDAARKVTYHVGKQKVLAVQPAKFVEHKENLATPEKNLKLSHICGYNGRGIKTQAIYQNLYYTSAPGEMIYPIAATCVKAVPANHAQVFFNGHTDDVTVLAYHPTRNIAASGQVDPVGKTKALVFVWDCATMNVLAKMDSFDKGVVALSFNGDGSQLLGIGNDNDHTLRIWAWEKDAVKPLHDFSCCKEQIVGAAFNPFKPDQFVTYGQKHIKFWQFSEEKKSYQAELGTSLMGKDKKVTKGINCAVWSDAETCVTGNMSGQIFRYKAGKLEGEAAAHGEEVGAVCMLPDGKFATGGYDGTVKVWDAELKEVQSFVLPKPVEKAKVCALSFQNGVLAVGTRRNHIATIELASGKIDIVVQGHYNEMWALAPHPSLPLVATGANDKQLIVWDIATKAPVPGKIAVLPAAVQCCSWSPSGELLVAGLGDGSFAVVDYATFKHTVTKVGPEVIAVAIFLPGDRIALGSWDQKVYVYDAKTFKQLRVFKGHSSSITHMIATVDGKYLMTNSKDYEILFWNTETGGRVSANLAADLEWTRWQCVLGWPVQAVYPPDSDGTDVNNVDQAPNSQLLASGDDFAQVKLFNYPVTDHKVHETCRVGKCHSSHVTNVRFSPDEKMLFSTGGADAALAFWEIA